MSKDYIKKLWPCGEEMNRGKAKEIITEKRYYKAQSRNGLAQWRTIGEGSDLVKLRAEIAVRSALNDLGEVRFIEVEHVERIIN